VVQNKVKEEREDNLVKIEEIAMKDLPEETENKVEREEAREEEREDVEETTDSD